VDAGRIRVLVVDDDAVARDRLRRALEAEPDLDVVGEASNAERALFEAIEHKPDVVLMALEAMEAVIQAVPTAKVVILSEQDAPRAVREAFDAGASGYVVEEAAAAEVVAAVRAVADGDRYVNPALGARLVAEGAEAQKRAELDPLSDREREVMRLLAKMLYISVRTAETHRKHIMEKLGLSSRAELVQHALAEGLVGQEPA
jgi:DNA-binding NarL/FixJ family response regulator